MCGVEVQYGGGCCCFASLFIEGFSLELARLGVRAWCSTAVGGLVSFVWGDLV